MLKEGRIPKAVLTDQGLEFANATFEKIAKMSNIQLIRTKGYHSRMNGAETPNPYNSTRAFLASKKIKVLDWPACSPDLNLIESVWGILASSVYKTGKQYNSISEFKDAVKTEWSKIHPSYLENLSHSMPNRIFQVIQNNGGFTSY
uniref:Uncharacterized protein n=1 Tax=Caenorhabditis japonica TaxID=281687 RepID=A0A8R1EUT0_CAEJA